MSSRPHDVYGLRVGRSLAEATRCRNCLGMCENFAKCCFAILRPSAAAKLIALCGSAAVVFVCGERPGSSVQRRRGWKFYRTAAAEASTVQMDSFPHGLAPLRGAATSCGQRRELRNAGAWARGPRFVLWQFALFSGLRASPGESCWAATQPGKQMSAGVRVVS